jgi:hypothetical protein
LIAPSTIRVPQVGVEPNGATSVCELSNVVHVSEERRRWGPERSVAAREEECVCRQSAFTA